VATSTKRLRFAGLLAGLLVGCGQPQVAREHRDLVLQLATATSSRDQGNLDRASAEVARLAARGELTDGEQKAFRAILDAAGTKSWDQARDLAYRLRDGQMPTAEDQERVAKRTLPEIKKPPSGKRSPP
jgi:hypothetical protein